AKCVSGGSSFFRPFHFVQREVFFPGVNFAAQLERIDDNTYRVISSDRPTDEQTKRLCDSLLFDYGGYPVLKIDGDDDEVACCVGGLNGSAIAIICLFGMIGMIAATLLLFCICEKCTEKKTAAQTNSKNSPPVIPASRKEEEPWSTDLNIKQTHQTPLPPAYS
ncbi:hypothetical protein PFISCL1PPCAC_28616, partial [Pristionchus fissidentatus]